MAFTFFIFYIVILIFSVMVHEISHGYVARRLGDDTAEMAGRLTFNPIRHIDPVGSILVPLVLYLAHLPGLAWAKPVPYNPHKLYKDFRYGPLKVALAGPLSNFALVALFALLARFSAGIVSPGFTTLLGFVAYLNAFLAIFNLVPIPPLDGSKILPLILPRRYGDAIERVGFFGILLVFLFISIFSGVISYLASSLFAFAVGPHALGVMCASSLGLCV